MKKNKKNYSYIGKEFGERFRLVREQAKISQIELAGTLGYKTSGSISNIESGRSNVDSKVLFELSKCIPVDLHWLITGENFNPQKRIEAQFKETYTELLNQYHSAQEAVLHLESKRQSGQPLTPEEEGQLLQNRGILRTSVRQMENIANLTKEQMEQL